MRESHSLVNRAWYAATIAEFHSKSDDEVLADLVRGSSFSILETQRDAWLAEFTALRKALNGIPGKLYLEFNIPRMGHRVDAVIFVQGIVLAVEFKVGSKQYLKSEIDQAFDYASDLKYFHEGSHELPVVPILVATDAISRAFNLGPIERIPGLYQTVCTNRADLGFFINRLLKGLSGSNITAEQWETSRYRPTPTIVEAARALFAGHGVADISRNDAGAKNLQQTTHSLIEIVESTKARNEKAICFVTGVPGAGKTLVGLDIATRFNDPSSELHSVFLSGNGPLVAILREALARDSVRRERLKGKKLKKGDATSRVKAFIQNVHHFRDECLRDLSRPPVDHIALFDEAQRAWGLEQTASFMKRKKNVSGFSQSEPAFLISCMDRREDWAVIVCLVGGGQEINTGEAGIGEWIDAVNCLYPSWHLYISPALTDSEYGAGHALAAIEARPNVHYQQALHLSTSMRSFRAENVSAFVKSLLDCEVSQAKAHFELLKDRYPIALTRNLDIAKQWVREQANGSERYGIVVSSAAERLKPYAMDVRSPVNPVKWFLDGKEDVRSSYYLEDVATEFQVQGLELDWVCVSWDADFRYTDSGWQHFSFRGSKWQHVKNTARKQYLKNAYRVLMTRARQGMVIFVPEGADHDRTRDSSFYNSTYGYLRSLGLPTL